MPEADSKIDNRVLVEPAAGAARRRTEELFQLVRKLRGKVFKTVGGQKQGTK